MAAEIKVNKTKQRSDTISMEARDASGNQLIEGQLISPSRAYRSPENNKNTYDTRDADTNVNQRKSYNAKFQFFTKPLGPGHYDPTCELTKKKYQGAGWGAERSP